MSLRLLIGFGFLVVSVPLATSAPPDDAKPNEYVQRIVKLIGDQDREFRAAALEQVRSAARGAANTQLFAAQLPTLDSQGQVALLRALADRGDVAARSSVLQLLTTRRDENVRAAAFEALGAIGTADDLPLLVKSLSTQSNLERTAARQGLTRISGSTINRWLATQSTSTPPEVRRVLIDVLATRRAGDELPTILAATVDDNADVRRAAMAALGRIGRPDQIAQMFAGILKAEKGTERDEAERQVAMICSRIENEDQRAEAMIAALKTVDVARRDQLLSLLGRVGGKKSIRFVAAIATGEDQTRRKLGIDALSKWPDASVADQLFTIADQATDSTERAMAFRGYVNVSAMRDGRSDKQRLDRLKDAAKAAKTPEETSLVLNRVRTAYDVESLRFVLPYVDQPQYSSIACETIVEIAHHREVRDPNKAEVDKMLDKVIAKSKDAVVVDRAKRYKRGETWDRRSVKSRL